MPEETPPTERKKTFGEKLKGVGKAIGRGAKKVPGIAYREVVKPYGEHLVEKFTEPVVSKPTIRRRPLPGTADLARAYGTKVEPYKAEERTTKATRPGGARRGFPSGAEPGTPTGLKRGAAEPHTVKPLLATQRRKLKRRPGTARPVKRGSRYITKSGRATPVIPREGETLQSESYRRRLAKQQAADRKAAREESLKPKVGTTREAAAKKEALTAGHEIGEYVEVIGRPEPKTPAKPTVKGMTRAKPKRKFSAKKTTKTLTEAAKKRREEMGKVQIDTTAQEMARMVTEQELAREAQRTEAELKEGRRPRREKARYRYRVRGTRRNEGRGR